MRTFNTEGERELGPREEKDATSGDIWCPTIVLVLLNFTTGFLSHTHPSEGLYYIISILLLIKKSGGKNIKLTIKFLNCRFFIIKNQQVHKFDIENNKFVACQSSRRSKATWQRDWHEMHQCTYKFFWGVKAKYIQQFKQKC